MAESVDIRRKRLKLISHQRGMLETSLLLRAFAERFLPDLNAEGLDRFEAVLDALDNDLLDWIVGKTPVPPHIDPGIIDIIKNIRNET
ncbi:MAG: succinate dehydrogenase assembly factor 2 [Rhodospirillales bacterium]|nr:succinate dehydrogenase assembly factor 2 [Rhodospirillales bacterium]